MFPSSGAVSGIGDAAYEDFAPNHTSGTITVKLGNNAISIYVSTYDHPTSPTTLEALARSALKKT